MVTQKTYISQMETFCQLLDKSPYIRGYSYSVENGEECITVDAMNEETEDCASVKIYFSISGDIKRFVVTP